MKFLILIGLFVLTGLSDAFGNNFRYLRTNEGLYDGEINSITQDSTGNMWFATWSGLIKYDGYNFSVYRPELGNPLSLPNKKIKIVFVDSKDNLWIASSFNLSVYNKQKNSFHTVRFQGFENGGIDIERLNEIENHLVIHTAKGFYLLPINKARDKNYVIKKTDVLDGYGKSRHYFHSSKYFANQLALISNSEDGDSRICFANVKFTSKDTSLNVVKEIEIAGWINAVEYIPIEKTLYIATSDGLHLYSLEKGSFLKKNYYRGESIKNLVYTSTHQIYMSLDGPELRCLDLHTGTSVSFISDPKEIGSLLSNDILSLYEDFSGSLWVGHQGQGLSIKNLYGKKFYSFKKDPLSNNSLNSNTIMCFDGTEKEIFIGCRSGGLNIISSDDVESDNAKFRRIPLGGVTHSEDGIWDIEKQSDTIFWLATDAGLFKLFKAGFNWQIKRFIGNPKIDHPIKKVLIDNNSNIWCGTQNDGLIFIANTSNNQEGANYRFFKDDTNFKTLSDNTVNDIYIDSKNRFWVATDKGLNLLNVKYRNLDLSGKQKPNLEFKRILAKNNESNHLNINEVNCIHENIDGKLWLGTEGGGINVLNPDTEDFSYFTTENGLPSNVVQSILPGSDGKLWIGTLNGLVSYNRFEEEPYFSVYDAYDGIQSKSFIANSCYEANDGRLFFGSDNGLICFYPREIITNEIKPKVAFSGLSFRTLPVNIGDTLPNGYVLSNSLNYTDKITLPYNRSYFKIDVATLHYQQPDKNKFEYFLKGYMRGWSTKSAKEDAVQFANLPFGKYELMIRGVSSDNVTSAAINTLMIEIQPPWYKTWYMTLIFVVLAISMIMGVVYIFVNRQRLVYLRKLNKVEIENNESKIVFLTNVAHELRTPLSLIIAPLEDLMKNVSAETHNWRNHLHLIYRNSNYLLRLINQIIDSRRLNDGKLKLNLEKTDIIRLVKDVVLNFKDYESRKDISLKLRVPSEKLESSLDAEKIEQVLYSLIFYFFGNAYKNQEITVSLQFLLHNNRLTSSNRGKILISIRSEEKELAEIDRDKIFSFFEKIDKDLDGMGEGISLSFSKSLIEMHNGTIEVETPGNKGIVFNIYLPLISTNKENRNHNGTELKTESFYIEGVKNLESGLVSEKEFAHRKILIVDKTEVRGFLQKFFSKHFICLTAEEKEEAMQIVRYENPSLVISDINLVKSDGYELCKSIKDDINTCHTPVILLAAKDASGDINKGYEMGADIYVTKPFNVNILLSQVIRLIENRELITEKYKTQNFMVEMNKNNVPKDEQFIKTVKKILEENISEPEFNVSKLADKLTISTTQLYRKLKETTGYTPVEFIRVLKLQKAFKLLENSDKTVKEVCFLTGFNNVSYFIKCFRERFGVTPSYFKENGLADRQQNKYYKNDTFV